MRWRSGIFEIGLREKIIEYAKYALIVIAGSSILTLGGFLFEKTLEYIDYFTHYALGIDRDSIAAATARMLIMLVTCFTGVIIYIYVKPVILNAKYIFYSSEKKLVIKSIKSILNEILLSDLNIHKDDLSQIEENSIRFVINSKKIEYEVLNNNTPMGIAYKILEHLSYKKIISGDGYVYRGVMGLGALPHKTIWNYFFKKMCEYENISPDDAAAIRRSVEEQIRNCG